MKTTIAPAVATVTERSQGQFDRESSTGRVLGIVAIALGALALLQLVRLQLGTVKRSNRLLNVGYLAATVALLVPGLDADERSVALDQQPGADQQHQGQCDLAEHQACAEAPTFHGHDALSSTLLERGGQVGS